MKHISAFLILLLLSSFLYSGNKIPKNKSKQYRVKTKKTVVKQKQNKSSNAIFEEEEHKYEVDDIDKLKTYLRKLSDENKRLKVENQKLRKKNKILKDKINNYSSKRSKY